MAEEKRKRMELMFKKEGIPINKDTIKAFEIALKVKIVPVVVP